MSKLHNIYFIKLQLAADIQGRLHRLFNNLFDNTTIKTKTSGNKRLCININLAFISRIIIIIIIYTTKKY